MLDNSVNTFADVFKRPDISAFDGPFPIISVAVETNSSADGGGQIRQI